MNESHHDKLLLAIKEYTDYGYTVIPLKGKRPVINDWDGFVESEPTLDQMVHEFQRCRGFVTGIAIATGYVESLAVLDLEIDEDITKHYLPNCPTVLSGGGGHHFYYDFPLDLDHEDNGISLKQWGISGDLKLNKGLITAPPSIHPETGKEYVWLKPLDTHMPRLPEWAVRLYQQKAQSRKVDWSTVELLKVPQGQRHTTAVRVAGKLLQATKQDDWDSFALPMLLAWGESACEPPMDEDEILSIYKSLSNKEALNQANKE